MDVCLSLSLSSPLPLVPLLDLARTLIIGLCVHGNGYQAVVMTVSHSLLPPSGLTAYCKKQRGSLQYNVPLLYVKYMKSEIKNSMIKYTKSTS